ncbi:DUF6057 family protein [Parabacteroides sp. PF5-6]|uniref:DUF6057 family protein n=1 Tax=Parabacteroides sp. PF5-6 TaxID=1742403 RepID=UPI002407034F|nr:DUF6057 family protein [Parabacteroides sp. PF5-6]MDF9831426.1 hypothetical protein [Parabacteroides sp. PF5-6]
MKIDAKDIVVSLLIAILLVMGSFLFFQFAQPYALFFKEQTQLFLFTSEYFLSYLDKPGTLACLVGDFLTQFLYLRGAGALVVSLFLLLEWIMAFAVLKRLGCGTLAPLWALLPVFAEGLFLAQLYYTLAIPVTWLLAMGSFLCYSAIRRRWLALLAGIVSVPFLYSLTGAGMFLFVLLLFLYEIYRRRGLAGAALLILVFAAAYPYLIRSLYLLTATQAYLYPLAQGRYGLSAVVLLLLAVIAVALSSQRDKVTARTFSFHVLWILILGIASFVFAVDKERETNLALASEAYFGNWERVYDLAEKEKQPNALATYYANISLSRRGELGDRLMEFYQPGGAGLFLPVNPEANWFTIFFSSDVHYYLGDMNMAQHSAMLGMIFSPRHRSSRMVKRLAEIHLALGDSAAAEKYLRLLDATLYHKKWAARMRDALYSEQPGDYPWLTQQKERLTTTDRLRRAADYPAALEALLESNPENLPARDYLLSYHLLTKNMPAFKAAFDRYAKTKGAYIPRAYSEALLIYLAATNASEKEFKTYTFDEAVVKAFAEYTALYEEMKGRLEPVRERFEGTYWMYYHFAEVN